MRLAARHGGAFAAMMFVISAGGPAGAECLAEDGVAALEASGFGDGDYRPFLEAKMPSGDYGYAIRQKGDSFLVRSFRPNFVLSYFVDFNGEDALIAGRYTAYDMLDSGPDIGSYTIYYDARRRDYVTLCGKEDAGLAVEPILAVLDDLRLLVPD